MPYNKQEWRASFAVARRRMDKCLSILEALDQGKVVPLGMDPVASANQIDMDAGIRTTLRTDFADQIQAVISDFETGLAP